MVRLPFTESTATTRPEVREKKPLLEYLNMQTKFRHLMKPGSEDTLAELQAEIDRKWEKLQRMAGDI